MLRRLGTAILPLLLLAALAGCASLPSPRQSATTMGQSAPAPRDFELSGRISVRHGETSYFTNISWQHETDRDEILLATPLGQGLAQLSRDAAGAHLRTADGRSLEAADWSALALQAFGVELPLAELSLWVIAEAPAEARRDDYGRPLSFLQDGWAVSYGSYASADPAARPQLIELRREGIALRLKIDAWQGER